MEVDGLANDLVADECVEGRSNLTPSRHHPVLECVVNDDYMSGPGFKHTIVMELRLTAESCPKAVKWNLPGGDNDDDDDYHDEGGQIN